MSEPRPSAHAIAFAQQVKDVSTMTSTQRESVARLLKAHPSALEVVHGHAKRWLAGQPQPAAAPTGPAVGPGKLSDADYAKLTASQKYDHARQFDQTQFRGTK